MEDTLLTVPEVAAKLSIHPEVVRRWLREKKLPAIQIGRRWRIRESDVERLIEGEHEVSISDDACTCFPRWIEFSGLPAAVTAEHGNAAWTLLRKLIELDCLYNDEPGGWFVEDARALEEATGIARNVIQRLLRVFARDGHIDFETLKTHPRVRVLLPLKTPLPPTEIDYRRGGLKNAPQEYRDRSCVSRYIRGLSGPMSQTAARAKARAR